MSAVFLIENFAPIDEYELDEIVQNEKGLTIKFNGLSHIIIVEYEYKWIWFSSSDESDRWRTTDGYFPDKVHKKNELFFVLQESKLKKWIMNEKYGTWNEDELEHHMFVTVNDIIEVISLARPNVIVVDNHLVSD